MNGYRYLQKKDDCGYFAEKISNYEYIFSESLDVLQLEHLIHLGFRHFAQLFFRPICSDCGLCQPIAVDAAAYRFSRNKRRVLKKAERFQCIEGTIIPDAESYELYRQHKQHFKDDGEAWENFQSYRSSFESLHPSSSGLKIYDGNTLIAVSHSDILEQSISLIYSYFSPEYQPFSLGTYIILYWIQRAQDLNKALVHLGYYVHGNRHSEYKAHFSPYKILKVDGKFMDIGNDKLSDLRFHPMPLMPRI
jgi:arginyl-tRNA--protein-N-Asp/Glu arginylyltransferase